MNEYKKQYKIIQILIYLFSIFGIGISVLLLFKSLYFEALFSLFFTCFLYCLLRFLTLDIKYRSLFDYGRQYGKSTGQLFALYDNYNGECMIYIYDKGINILTCRNKVVSIAFNEISKYETSDSANRIVIRCAEYSDDDVDIIVDDKIQYKLLSKSLEQEFASR